MKLKRSTSTPETLALNSHSIFDVRRRYDRFSLPDTPVSWIIIAQRDCAKILQRVGRSRTLRLVRMIENPDGRLKNHEIESDRPGDGPHESAEERLTENFARLIAHVLEDARNQQLYDHLVLASEPRFLGRLRSALSSPTLKMVSATVEKNLTDMPEQRLSEVIDQASA